MPCITREQFRKASAVGEPTEVNVKGLGTVKIVPMTQKVRNDARNLASDQQVEGFIDITRFNAYIVIGCVVDPKLDFKEDLQFIESLKAGVMDDLIKKIFEISGIDIGVEEVKKN